MQIHSPSLWNATMLANVRTITMGIITVTAGFIQQTITVSL